MSTHDKCGTSTCFGACARAFQALVTRGTPRAISGARSALLGATRRTDGRKQATCHGHPPYYFAGDKRPGQTAGAGLTRSGGRWDPVSAAGRAVRKRPIKRPHFEHPKLGHGMLTIKGTAAGVKIALRLKASQPDTLQVDVGDKGSGDFSFKRKQITMIAGDARTGDDLVRIDEINGIFTDSIPTTIDGGAGNDTLAGGFGAEPLLGGDGNDLIDGFRATT